MFSFLWKMFARLLLGSDWFDYWFIKRRQVWPKFAKIPLLFLVTTSQKYKVFDRADGNGIFGANTDTDIREQEHWDIWYIGNNMYI